MTEAIATPEIAPEAPPAPPSSLWQDALRRLMKNRLAVAGLVWIIFIGALAALAPWIVPFDPQHQEWWTGKRPPGYEHATLELLMTFARGQPAPAPFLDATKTGDHAIELELEQLRRRDVRVRIAAGGVVERIELGPDYDAEDPHGETPQSWRTLEGERIVWKDDAGAPHSVSDVAIDVSKPAPAVLGGGASERTFVGEWRKGERTLAVAARIESGKVAAIEREKKPTREVKVEAEQVRAARVDGRPFVHSHLLGTDDAGRDILSRVIFGGRISLLVGIVATIVSLVIGVGYGAIAGYAGGKIDEVMMRFVDILYAIPFMFVVILLLVLLGRSLILLFIAIGAVEWLTMARIVRGQVLSLKEKEFVEAARVAGTRPAEIVARHLIPNTLGAVIVYTTLTIPEVILTEAFLSFLGLSVQYQGKALESWGSLTESGTRLAQGGFPWLLLASATALSATLFSLNFLGDGLRDALDPRQKGR